VKARDVFQIYFSHLQYLLFVLMAIFSSFLAGIRSWDVDLKCCDLDQQLQLFITRHSAHFSSKIWISVASSLRVALSSYLSPS
uniref:Microtubule-associated protein 1B/S N-terminal domain-containing protein n=1 Tax=Fundulus heteroclitus TaxID=8078 RepID=A0A3Q2QVD1_FUNHE